jgi:uncharacterized membrane protein HdeD (DUF308 family)
MSQVITHEEMVGLRTKTEGAPIDQIGSRTWWFVWLSIAFLFGGLAALTFPTLAKTPMAATIGWTFAVIGAVQLVTAWQVRDWGGAVWQWTAGAALIVAATAVLFEPVTVALGVPLLTGMTVLIIGVILVFFAVNYRPHAGWSWMLASALAAVVAGVLIAVSWPSGADWSIAIVSGCALMFCGCGYLMAAAAALHGE